LAREGPVSFIALLDALLGQIVDGLYGDKLWSYFIYLCFFLSVDFCSIRTTLGRKLSNWEIQ
jgi:hypothetical protein